MLVLRIAILQPRVDGSLVADPFAESVTDGECDKCIGCQASGADAWHQILVIIRYLTSDIGHSIRYLTSIIGYYRSFSDVGRYQIPASDILYWSFSDIGRLSPIPVGVG